MEGAYSGENSQIAHTPRLSTLETARHRSRYCTCIISTLLLAGCVSPANSLMVRDLEGFKGENRRPLFTYVSPLDQIIWRASLAVSCHLFRHIHLFQGLLVADNRA